MMRRSTLVAETGTALLIVILVLTLVLALGGALVLTSSVETRIAGVAKADALLLSAAETAAFSAVVELRSADWNALLNGGLATFVDGPPAGLRAIPDGTTIDLEAETGDMQCGQPACTDLEIASVAEERPWGTRNPRWRLFAYGLLSGLLSGDPSPPSAYVVTWIADDPADSDGDPARDGDAADNPGRGVLVLASRAYGPFGIRRTVQLVVERSGTDLRILSRQERQP